MSSEQVVTREITGIRVWNDTTLAAWEVSPDDVEARAGRFLATEVAALRTALRDKEAELEIVESLARGFETRRLPCGHLERYAHTENGGVSSACYACELAQMTEDRDLWRDDHGDDCPYKDRAERAEAAHAAADAKCEARVQALKEENAIILEGERKVSHELRAERDAAREESAWISVEERLPERPENHIEASVDVIAATIMDGEIDRWDRVNLCAFGHDDWARDGILIKWIPTHWRLLPFPPSVPANKGETDENA